MKEPMPRVAVIILSWNRRDEVLKTIALLEHDDYLNKEVIVINNGSIDDTQEAVRSRYPTVRVMRLPYNVGCSGFDFGIANTDADYIVCLDDDSAPDPNAISRMVEVFEANAKVGIVSFNIYGGAYSTEDWEKMEPSDLLGYINCGVGLRPKAVIDAGFNDRDFYLYTNEADLAIRILNKGYEIVFDPSIRAHHRTSPIGRSNKRLRTLSTRNEAWMVMKYFRLAKIPVMIWRVLFWNANYSRTEGPLSVWYAFHGLAAALRHWQKAWKKRQAIRPEILARYERNYWTFQPITPWLRRAVRRRIQALQRA